MPEPVGGARKCRSPSAAVTNPVTPAARSGSGGAMHPQLRARASDQPPSSDAVGGRFVSLRRRTRSVGVSSAFVVGRGGGASERLGDVVFEVFRRPTREGIGGRLDATGTRRALMRLPEDATLRTLEVRTETMSGGTRPVGRFDAGAAEAGRRRCGLDDVRARTIRGRARARIAGAGAGAVAGPVAGAVTGTVARPRAGPASAPLSASRTSTASTHFARLPSRVAAL